MFQYPTKDKFQPSPSLSKNPGSFSTLRSNLTHQSRKLLNGTTSSPPLPVFVEPAKLARKLKAFLMMRCARILVGIMAEGGVRWFVDRIKAEEGD